MSLVAFCVLAASAGAGSGAADSGISCTQGVSSVGPVTVRGASVVGASEPAYTEACLP